MSVKVPHCRKCPFFVMHKPEGSKKAVYYKCRNILPYRDNKYISYQEAKTSPNWCYKRTQIKNRIRMEKYWKAHNIKYIPRYIPNR